MKRFFLAVTMGLAALTAMPSGASAALASQDGMLGRVVAGDVLQAHQYCLPETRVVGDESIRQQVTVWQVTSGTWNGESLAGLSLVLVKNTSDRELSAGTINCYVSHLATAAQRLALISAYAAAQAISPSEVANWRVEPAVIRFEFAGQTVVVHLGLVA